eukprot:46015-Pleurochrysis_carterae.AAC.3
MADDAESKRLPQRRFQSLEEQPAAAVATISKYDGTGLKSLAAVATIRKYDGTGLKSLGASLAIFGQEARRAAPLGCRCTPRSRSSGCSSSRWEVRRCARWMRPPRAPRGAPFVP